MPLGPGSRPAWQLRIGLWLYDHVAGHSSLPRGRGVAFETDGVGPGLRPEYRRGFAYSDAWGDDARLVVANARGAADIVRVDAELTAMMGAKMAGPYCKNLRGALRRLDR